MIYDVPADQSDDLLKPSIYEQNLEGLVNKNEFQQDFYVRFKAGPRGKPTVHLVVETSNNIRKLLLRQGRIYIYAHCERSNLSRVSRKSCGLLV